MSGPRVLIIDNSASTCLFIATALKRAGYAVEVALNGRDGIAKVAKYRPQCMIVDVFLHDTSGYAVCRQVRQRFSRKSLSIILTSAREAPLDVSYGARQGADHHLPKPLTEEALIQAVWDLMPTPWRVTVPLPGEVTLSNGSILSDSAVQRAVPALSKLIPHRLFDEDAMRIHSPFTSIPTIRDNEARQLYAAIDGKRTVSEIATMIGLDTKDASRAVVLLLRNKFIQMYDTKGTAVESDVLGSELQS